MSASAIKIVALVLLAATPVWPLDCSIPPIYVDIQPRAVHGSDRYMYGTFIGFGTPAQNESLWPSLVYNETSISSMTYCLSGNGSACATGESLGGFFDPSASSSWRPQDQYVSSDPEEQKTNAGVYGMEKAHVYMHQNDADNAVDNTIDMPIRIATSPTSRPGRLGLGPSSPFLSALVSSRRIASRFFSLYVGNGFDRVRGSTTGSLVLGGYDSSRFTGPVYNHTLRPSIPPTVHVSDISIAFTSGNQARISLFDTLQFPDFPSALASGFDAQITTDDYPFSLPYELTQNFITMLNGVPSPSPDGSLALTTDFEGSMVITLSDGFAITLPNSMVYDSKAISPVAARDRNSTAPFTLGLAYLTQVYLMLDYDAGSMHLAKAAPDAPFISLAGACPATVPSANNHQDGGLRGAAMVGGVVGAVIGGLALFALVGWLAFKWWHGKKAPAAAEDKWVDVEGLETRKIQLKGSRLAQMELCDDDEDEGKLRPAKGEFGGRSWYGLRRSGR
ncbi:MAG: hypothetical protein M1829_003472 [Trizodia sp. TS-e1964]|nr:MAG: hypothetical protein M1829_003472 [Trizodia sp. TS-e1964]